MKGNGNRQVIQVVTPRRALEGAGVWLRRSFPTPVLDYLDPFLLLDDRVKPAASHVPSGTVGKAGLELSGPADGSKLVLQSGWAYQESEGE